MFNEIETPLRELFECPWMQTKAIPFSESRVRAQSDMKVQTAMAFIDAMFGLKWVGHQSERFTEEQNKIIVDSAIAVLQKSNKIDTSQGEAIRKQLFS